MRVEGAATSAHAFNKPRDIALALVGVVAGIMLVNQRPRASVTVTAL
jgi:hypothetical protein